MNEKRTSFVYAISTTTKKTYTMNTNTKGTLLAIAIMAVIIVIGLIYGVQLEKSFYISNSY